ncbi:aminopeptidase N C-terminal domain-containing protein [Streptococcus pyogenes]
MGRWKRFDETRATQMRAALERIVATPGLSKDVLEQASKSLA